MSDRHNLEIEELLDGRVTRQQAFRTDQSEIEK